jgi:hypothetical protein
MGWIILAFIFSNLFSFLMGYILLTVWVKFVDNLPPKEKETESDKDDD